MLGIYCRISREKEEGKDRSIEDQKQIGISLAKRLNISYKVYIDEGFSGTLANIKDRPQFSLLIDDILEGKINTVYSYDQSRLERNPSIRFIIKKIFNDNNISYYTESGEVHLDNDEQELFGDLLSVINQFYVKSTSKKIKSVLKRNALNGKAHSSIFPYGYNKDEDGYLIIEKEEAEIVKKIFKLSLEGIGTRKIAEILNEEKVPTRYNKIGVGTIKTKNKFTGKITEKEKKDIIWSGNTIRNIITNSIYKGVRVFSGVEYKAPIIIEPNLWSQVNCNLRNNANNSGKKVEHKYLLKGFLECGVCGNNMYGRTRVNKKDNYYMCSSKRIKGHICNNRSINIDFADACVWDILIRQHQILTDITKDDSSSISRISSEINEIKEQIEKLEKRKKRAIKLLLDGVINEIDIKEEIETINKKILESQKIEKNLIDELSYEKRALQLRKSHDEDIENIKENTPFNKKKEFISKYVERIKIFYEKDIKYFFFIIKYKTNETNVYFIKDNVRNFLKKEPLINYYGNIEGINDIIDRAEKILEENKNF